MITYNVPDLVMSPYGHWAEGEKEQEGNGHRQQRWDDVANILCPRAAGAVKSTPRSVRGNSWDNCELCELVAFDLQSECDMDWSTGYPHKKTTIAW